MISLLIVVSDSLNVKLGHRRVSYVPRNAGNRKIDSCTKKLQRAIAEYRGVSFERLAGPAAQEALPESGRGFEGGPAAATESERPSIPSSETKRKYRRHPKPDDNAPDRPPSAYVIFSNRIRDEVKDQGLSFTQIAKLVGDRWQKLDPASKEPYEAQASAAKEKYNTQLTAYRKSEEYREYAAYLADFKIKHGQATEAKRPKLEPESSGSIISTKSMDASQEGRATPSSHFRGGSMGSSASSPFIGGVTQLTSSMGSIPPRPQMPLSRSGTPPSVQQSRDYFRMGLLSSHSSVSEESTTMRSEVPEAVVRTAGLSLGAQSATPPLPAPLPSASSMDSIGSVDSLPRSRLSYFVQHQHPHVTLPTHVEGIASPGSGVAPFPPTLPSPTAQEAVWRNRNPDFRGFQEALRDYRGSVPLSSPSREQLSPTQLPPMLTQDRPPEYFQGQGSRILPPPRAPSLSAPGLPNLGRGRELPQPLATESLQIRQASHEETRPALNRSESDAANALAGLASGVPRPDTTKPYGQQPQQPR